MKRFSIALGLAALLALLALAPVAGQQASPSASSSASPMGQGGGAGTATSGGTGTATSGGGTSGQMMPQTGHPQDQNTQLLSLMSLAVLGSLVLASGVLLRRRAAH